MNAGRQRTVDIPLDFLASDTKYTAHVYSHDPSVPTRTHVRIDRMAVDSTTVLKAPMSPQGGQAIRIELE